MAKSPLAVVQETFGDKAKLVQAVETLASEELWLARVNKEKGLAHVSNGKLLRLHATLSEVKEKFGTRAKLIDAILELEKRSKDVGLRAKLASWPVPRLYDSYKSAAKRNARVNSEAASKSSPKAREPAVALRAAKSKAPAGKATGASSKKAPAKKTAR